MAKLKDGVYKLIGTALGNDAYVLLAGGGSKLATDFIFPTKNITPLTGYKKGTNKALTTSDSLNTALGKLEYKADLGVSAYNKINMGADADNVINTLNEIIKAFGGITENETILDKFIPRAGTLLDKPITGVLNFNNTDGIKLQSSNKNLKIWEIHGDSEHTYGFHELYLGTKNGNDNSLILCAHNQTGTHVKVREVKLDGSLLFYTTTTFSSTPFVNSTKVSLEGHTHKYAGSNSSGGAAYQIFENAEVVDFNTLTGNENCGKLYYHGGSNTSTNKPWNVDAYGAFIFKAAIGYTAQLLASSNENNGLYFRCGPDSNMGNWNKLAYITDIPKSLPANGGTASALSTKKKTAWGQLYWTADGIPTSISGTLTSVGGGGAITIGQINNTGDNGIYLNNSTHWFRIASTGDIDISAGISTLITTYTERQLHLDSGGNVGIGIEAPSQKLTVNGNILSNSFITAINDGEHILMDDGTRKALSDLSSSHTHDNYVTLNTVLTITATKTLTSYFKIIGTAADRHLITRGIGGCTTDGTKNDDLYVNYGTDYGLTFGKIGLGHLTSTGSIKATSFLKINSNDKEILLGNGSVKNISDFWQKTEFDPNTKTDKYSWTSKIKGNTWSTIAYVEGNLGTSFLLLFKATRSSVVYNNLFAITCSHSHKVSIVKISGSKYTNIQIRIFGSSYGNCYIELYDNNKNISNTTIQTVVCTIIPISCNIVTPYIEFTTHTDHEGFTEDGKLDLNTYDCLAKSFSGNFYKIGSDNSKILLGGGLDKPISDFSLNNHNHDTIYAKLSEHNLKKIYTINLSNLSDTKFYPVTFERSDRELDCEIHSPNKGGDYKWNLNRIHFLLTSEGYSDTLLSFCILSYNVYDRNEITIGCIGRGSHAGSNCFWLRGGLTYTVICNHVPTLLTLDIILNKDEKFTVGSNYDGSSSNTNVSNVWTPLNYSSCLAKVSSNVASATKLQTARKINGVLFDGTTDITVTANPNSHTHSYTDLTGSGTVKNQVICSTGVANKWELKTLGSRAFDSTSYLPLHGKSDDSDKLDGFNSSDFVRAYGYLDANTTYTSGSFRTNGTAHHGAVSQGVGINIPWRSNTYTIPGFSAQLFIPCSDNGETKRGLWWRDSNDSEFNSWYHVWDNHNLTKVSQLVNDKGYITGYTNNYLTGVSGTCGETITFTRLGLDNLTWNSSHNHDSRYINITGDTMLGFLGHKSNYLIKPIADYRSSSGEVKGAITIILPAGIGNTMVSMWIDVYNYTTNTSFSVHLGGYTYNNSTWGNNPFALVYGAKHTVRLGHDGTSFVIYIGELSSSWSYPQISVRDVILGYVPLYSNWIKDWKILFTTDAFKKITATISNRFVWHSNNDGSGSGLDADLLDGKHASAFALAHSHPYLPYTKITSKIDFNTITTDGVYNTGTDSNTTSYTSNSAFNTGHTTLSFNMYKSESDDRTVLLALDGYGEAKIRGFRTSKNWYTLLSSKNSSINGRKITINGVSTTWTNDGGNAATLNSLESTAFVRSYNLVSSANDVYDAGIANILNGLGGPGKSVYGAFITIPYRKGFGNTIPDYAGLIYISNDNPKTLYYRTSSLNKWDSWRTVWDTNNLNPDNYLLKTALAVDSKKLNGNNESSYFRYRGDINPNYVNLTESKKGLDDYLNPLNGVYTKANSGSSDMFIAFTGSGSTSGLDLLTNYNRGAIFYRHRIDANRIDGDWIKLWSNHNLTKLSLLTNDLGFISSYKNYYLTEVSGSGNGTVTFTRNGLKSLTWDSSHNHDSRYYTKDQINSIQIGGVNLLRKSNSFKVGSSTNSDIINEITSLGELKIIVKNGVTNWNSTWANATYEDLQNLRDGDICTVSFLMRSSDSTTIPQFYFKSGMGYFQLKGNLSTEYSTVYYTTIWKKNNTMYPYFGWRNCKGTYYVKAWKIERGDKATDWVPSLYELKNGYVEKVGYTTKGSASLPIYLNNGTPTACTGSSIFNLFINSGNDVCLTIAGELKKLTVGYASNAGQVGGKPITDYYWADIKISSTSSQKTSPTFLSNTISGGDLTLWGTNAGFINRIFNYNEGGFARDVIRFYHKAHTSESDITGRLGYLGSGDEYQYIYIGGNDWDKDNFRIYKDHLQFGSKTILHSTNYNNYAPKLNGTGASGTWNINITGNAATVSRFSAGNKDNGEHDCNKINTNGVWYYNSNGPSKNIGATTNDGALYSQAYSTSLVGQIALDYKNGNLFVRGKNNGTWTTWNKVLTTANEFESNIVVVDKTLTVTSEWMDTGITDTNFTASGTYIVLVNVSANDSTGDMWSCLFSGIMSWYDSTTNDGETDEIILHRSGHAYENTIYLRTVMTSSPGHIKLLIAANQNIGKAYSYTFKFKRVI